MDRRAPVSETRLNAGKRRITTTSAQASFGAEGDFGHLRSSEKNVNRRQLTGKQ